MVAPSVISAPTVRGRHDSYTRYVRATNAEHGTAPSPGYPLTVSNNFAAALIIFTTVTLINVKRLLLRLQFEIFAEMVYVIVHPRAAFKYWPQYRLSLSGSQPLKIIFILIIVMKLNSKMCILKVLLETPIHQSLP